MSENTPMQRPLSPHIQIYRWTLTMMLSILHRATGIALYAGTALLAWWLLAAALHHRVVRHDLAVIRRRSCHLLVLQ